VSMAWSLPGNRRRGGCGLAAVTTPAPPAPKKSVLALSLGAVSAGVVDGEARRRPAVAAGHQDEKPIAKGWSDAIQSELSSGD